MSIEKYQTAKGVRYRVRMTLPGGKRTDKRGFTSKREANLYLADFQVQRARGTFVPERAGRVLMSQLVRQSLENDIHRAPADPRDSRGSRTEMGHPTLGRLECRRHHDARRPRLGSVDAR